MGNLLAYKRALRGLHSYGPKEIWIAPFTITWKAELRVFRNKVEIRPPFNGSNKLLTILHYGVSLHFLFFQQHCLAPPCSRPNLNVWFILFFMVNLNFSKKLKERSKWMEDSAVLYELGNGPPHSTSNREPATVESDKCYEKLETFIVLQCCWNDFYATLHLLKLHSSKSTKNMIYFFYFVFLIKIFSQIIPESQHEP